VKDKGRTAKKSWRVRMDIRKKEKRVIGDASYMKSDCEGREGRGGESTVMA